MDITPEIQQYVQQKIAQSQEKAKFTTKNATYHLHGGLDSPHIPPVRPPQVPYSTLYGVGAPLMIAPKGTLYVNTAATTTTTRLYINIGNATWASFTASA